MEYKLISSYDDFSTKSDVLPVRYPFEKIDTNIFTNFFTKNGDYPGKSETNNEVAPVWQQCFRNWTNSSVDVFQAMEDKNLNQLANIYENYYMQGVSEGASSGKALADNGGNGYQYKLNKANRNIERAKTLGRYLNINFNNEKEVYKFINEKFKIPITPNIGQTWGWWCDDLFIHFELADYIYFLDIIVKLFKDKNITKTSFLGDGSGLLSSLVYNNCDITSSNHIDLGHFLLKQYLNNHTKSYINYYYAENFDYKTPNDSQILINQDSFPEMSDESVAKYVNHARHNEIPYILSYNKEVTFEGGNPHSDFRKAILSNNYVSEFRIEPTIMREGYKIELFKFVNNG
jgi:hypothetical protein